MSWRGADCRTIDPMELESRVSTEDSMAFLEMIVSEEPSPQSKRNLEKVMEIMESLPPREADFIDLYFFRHLKQTAISQIYGVSQPTVCYRLKRAAKRIRFWLQMPDVTEEDVRTAVAQVLEDPVDVEIMVLMYETTCQSEVAKRLNTSQGKVRHRFMRTVKSLQDQEGLELYADLFTLIAGNLNIKREVQRDGPSMKVRYVVD